MNITLNGENKTITSNATIMQMLEECGYANMLVAVAVNDSFVPKSEHTETQITEGDRIDIVAPMQGG